MKSITMYKTRIAPTPSGLLHAGNVFSFVLTYLLARKTGASILLRIDDVDQERYRTHYADAIFKTLHKLGISWDEGPENIRELEHSWSQRHRTDLYNHLLEELKQKEQIFACQCSRKDIRQSTEDGGYPGTCCTQNIPLHMSNVAWRLHSNLQKFSLKNWSGKEQKVYLPKNMCHFVVKRKDGLPSYQLASLADDLHFGITHIVRGTDLWDSTMAQLFLARELQQSAFSQVHFYHHPLLKNNAGKKFSKTQKSAPVQEQLQNSQKRENFFRYLSALLNLPEEFPDLEKMEKYLLRYEWEVPNIS